MITLETIIEKTKLKRIVNKTNIASFFIASYMLISSPINSQNIIEPKIDSSLIKKTQKEVDSLIDIGFE